MRLLTDFYSHDLSNNCLYVVRCSGNLYDAKIEEYDVINKKTSDLEDLIILRDNLINSGDLITLISTRPAYEQYQSMKPKLLFFMHYNIKKNVISISDSIDYYSAERADINSFTNTIAENDFRDHISLIIDHMFKHEYKEDKNKQIKLENPHIEENKEK